MEKKHRKKGATQKSYVSLMGQILTFVKGPIFPFFHKGEGKETTYSSKLTSEREREQTEQQPPF